MTWRGPGDKVLTLEQRLASLERRTNLLVVSNIVLVVLNAPAVGPIAHLLPSISAVIGRLVAM